MPRVLGSLYITALSGVCQVSPVPDQGALCQCGAALWGGGQPPPGGSVVVYRGPRAQRDLYPAVWRGAGRPRASEHHVRHAHHQHRPPRWPRPQRLGHVRVSRVQRPRPQWPEEDAQNQVDPLAGKRYCDRKWVSGRAGEGVGGESSETCFLTTSPGTLFTLLQPPPPPPLPVHCPHTLSLTWC